MVKLVNRAKMATATTGTGVITLGSAVAGYQSFAAAGVSDGATVRYVVEEGNDWEIGTGVYTTSGTTLSRAVLESSNSDAAITLAGAAEVYVTATSEDFNSAIKVSSQIISADTTVGATETALSVSPVEIADGVTVTVATGGRYITI
tara:strand:+ start:648 stop:1088 length:441 start_codon:yes stop_codon:yes gene_type:complete